MAKQKLVMKNTWIKFGCFLTGISYELVANSSESSKKDVKKYTSALLILMLEWFAVGYLLVTNYFTENNSLYGLLGGFISIFIIVNVERQIILARKLNKWTYSLRIALALIIAILGATVIDQIIFQEDLSVLKKKIANQEIPARAEIENASLENRINDYTNQKDIIATELADLKEELSINPVVLGTTSTSSESTDVPEDNQNSNTPRTTKRTTTRQMIQNPVIYRIGDLEEQIRDQNAMIDSTRKEQSRLYTKIQEEYMAERGFLTELGYMMEILAGSRIATFVYLLWFALLVILEILILSIKSGSDSSDYVMMLEHQEQVRKAQISSLK